MNISYLAVRTSYTVRPMRTAYTVRPMRTTYTVRKLHNVQCTSNAQRCALYNVGSISHTQHRALCIIHHILHNVLCII